MFIPGWDLQGMLHIKNLETFELWETANTFSSLISFNYRIEVLTPISHQNIDERAKQGVICIKNINLLPDIFLYNYCNKCRHFLKVAFPY